MDYLSNGIAFAALLVAGAGLYHSTKQGKLTQRPVKLDAFRITKEFLIYCSKYRTMYTFRQVTGTRDLWSEIDAFAWNIEKLGPTGIYGLSHKIEEIVKKAKKLQRELERLTAAMNQNERQEELEKLEDRSNSNCR